MHAISSAEVDEAQLNNPVLTATIRKIPSSAR